MAKYNILLCLALFTVAVQSGPISIEYGVPHVPMPFEEYGPPPHDRSDIDEFIVPENRQPEKIDIQFNVPRTLFEDTPKPVKKVETPVEGQLLLSPLRSSEVVAPPNTKIDLRDDRNQYSVGFQSPDGTEIKEQGRLISTDNGWEYVIAKTGSYKYVSPEGQLVDVNWVADEKGFRILSSSV